MKRRHKPHGTALLAIVAMMFVGGCVSAEFIRTGASYPPKPEDCEIMVFTSRLPDRDYEEIGVIEGEGTDWRSSLEDVLPEMKHKACRAGGDAIIVTESRRSTFRESNDAMRLDVMATVIRWTGE